ncbi:MAG: hypothetical protein K2P58_05070 [Hyphomonadaceae bacterium]|nr:hypothetical protein [Hyphomonadaceae bacterium]
MASSPSDGRRDLALIRASGSTARVLNLALVYERFGDTDGFGARPLFRSSKLNRALIIKHAVREHERGLFDRPEPHTTKIVFPYSPIELELGGSSVMLGERRFEHNLRQALGASMADDDFLADLDLVTLLHELPSFDPFLLKEQLKRAGHEPDACFFDVSEADTAAMLSFVQGEIAPLVEMAFGVGGRRAEKLALRLAEKLMTEANAQMLAPLRETMRLNVGEFAEGAFAWKGYLYYKWMGQGMARIHETFESSFSTCAIASDDHQQRYEIGRLRHTILRGIDRVGARVTETVRDYDRDFAALVRGDAGPFRRFLCDAPAKFVPLGEAAGAVKHIHSFWGFRFPAGAPLKLEAGEALDVLQEFERMLRGLRLVTSQEVLLG